MPTLEEMLNGELELDPMPEPRQLRAEQDTDEVLRRGRHAREMLTDPMFVEALRETEKKLLRAWKATKPEETEQREAIWRQVRSLTDTVGNLHSVFQTGRLTTDRLALEETREGDDTPRPTRAARSSAPA